MAALLAITVCGCAEDQAKKPEENVYPANYRAQIVAQVRRQLDDLRDIRDAYIAEPVIKISSYSATPRYIACIRFNARDRSGTSKGSNMAAYFYAGQITQLVDASGDPKLCGDANVQPFPELQRL
jgi:hypothetical protein